MNILAVEASASGSRVHQGLAGIATLLARTLPAGASVAVGWHDPLLGSGTSTSERAGSRQVRAVEALLGGAAASGAKGTELSDAWTLDATRMALVVDAGLDTGGGAGGEQQRQRCAEQGADRVHWSPLSSTKRLMAARTRSLLGSFCRASSSTSRARSRWPRW